MSKHATPFLVPPLQADPQLQRLNEKISKLAAVKPAADVFGAFGLAAHLSDLAIEAALELGQLPGVDTKALQPTIKFWELGAGAVQHGGPCVCGSESHACGRAGRLQAFATHRRRGD